MNPSTVWHLFMADARRLRWLIIAVLAFLLIEAGQFYFNDPWNLPASTSSTSGNLPEMYQGHNYLWLPLFSALAATFAAALGWQGATAEKLRPVRRREIAVSKLLSLILFLYLPQCLVILLVLTKHGIPFQSAMLGLAGAAGAFVPLWIILAAYGRLAGTMWRFIVAGAATIAVIFLLAVVFKSFTRGPLTVLSLVCNDGWGRYAGPMTWSILGASAVWMLALTAFCIRRWKPFWRCATAAVGVMAIVYGLRDVEWFMIKPTAATKASLTQNVLDGIQVVFPRDLNARLHRQLDSSSLFVSGQLTTRGLPPSVFCNWSSSTQNNLSVESRILHSRESLYPANSRPNIPSLHPPFGNAEFKDAIKRGLPECPVQAPPDNFEGQSWAQYFELSSSDDFQGPFHGNLDSEMTGLLYRYDMVANVPIDQTGTVFCHGGALRIGTITNGGPDGFPRVSISFQCPTYGIAENLPSLFHEFDPASLWKLYLHVPELNELVPLTNMSYSAEGPLLGGGATHRMLANFNRSTSVLAKARLVILEPVILGTVTRKISGHPLTLKFSADTEARARDSYYTRGPYMAPNEFLEYARPRRPDPAAATDEEFGRWLQLVLTQNTMEDWTRAELSFWAPRKLDVLLKATKRNWHSDLAIDQSMPESRKSQVIAKVADYPQLVDVLMLRGWVDEAREPLLQLFQNDKLWKTEHLIAVANLNEPATFTRLLAWLETTRSVRLYNVMRQKPGIEPRLSETVKRIFLSCDIIAPPPLWSDARNGNELQKLRNLAVPLMHGMDEAKRAAILAFPWFGGRAGSNPEEFMEQHFQLPPGIKRDTRESNAFFMGLKPEDCNWDPLIRRWVATKF